MLIEYKIRFLPDGVVVSQNIDGNPPDQDGPGAGDGDDPPPFGNPPDGDGPGGSASMGSGPIQAVILGSVIIGRASGSGKGKPPKPVSLKKKR